MIKQLRRYRPIALVLGSALLTFVSLSVRGTHGAQSNRRGHCRPDPVLIVVDMQNGFIRPSTEQVVPKVQGLVESWAGLGGEVVFTRFINTPDSQYERLIGWKRLQSAPETDLVSTLAPLAKTVIDKNFYSVFTSEKFRDLIQKKAGESLQSLGLQLIHA
jgi:nicotinamidase-related amidase